MARQYKTGLIITGDASGGIKAMRATDKELSRLNKGFERGSQRSRQFGGEVRNSGQRLGEFSQDATTADRSLSVLRTTAVGVGAALAGAFAVSNLRGQAQLIAETDALAKSIGMATGELQAWDYAGQQVGLGAGKIGDIFKDVSDKLGDFVATGGGEAADLFENLNLNIAQLQRLSPDQQLLKIGEAISKIEDPSQRVFYLESIANDASRLLPLLENNAAGLREFTREAQSLGVAMDQVDIDNAAAANQAMVQLGGTMQGLTNQVVSDLGPGLADAADSLTDLIREAGGAEQVLGTLVNVGGTLATLYGARLAAGLADAVAGLGRYIAASIAQANAAAVASRAAAARTAENLRVAQSEQAAAQRALANSQATAAATGNTALRTRALAQLAVANQRAAGASAAHTAAINTQSAAMSRATVAGHALAGATRVGAGALALVGGPAGAAIIAGGALYYYRDSLSTAGRAANGAKAEIDELTKSLDLNSQAAIENSIATLTAKLNEAEARAAAASEGLDRARLEMTDSGATAAYGDGQEFNRAKAETDEYRKAIEGLESDLDELNAAQREFGGGVADTSRLAAKAAEELAKTYKQQASGLAQQIALFGETGEAAKLRYEIENGSLQALAPEKQQYLLQLAEELDGLNAAKEEAEKYEKQTKSLIQQYDQQYQKVAQLHDAVDQLNTAYNDPDVEMSFAQYQRMLAAIRDEMQQLALDADPMAQEMARAWEEASNRIDETFADAFAGAFDSFDDFGDQLLDGFKRLLAELAYQATLKPIVVGFTGDMQGMMSGASGGGFGGTISGAKSVLDGMNGTGGLLGRASNWLGVGSGIGAAGSAATGYAGAGFASQVATGGYTGFAGSAAAGAGAAGGGGLMAGLGSAMPWVGGALAIDQVLGLGIVDGIVDGISSLFGSSTKPKFELGTLGANERPQFENGSSVRASSAFGQIGFIDSGTAKLKSTFGGLDKADEFLEQIATLDNAIASLASNENELAEMAAAVQGVRLNASNPGGIAEQLSKRSSAALESLGDDFGAFVRNLEGGIEEVVQQAVAGRQAFALMSGAAERLNLNIQTGGVAAYEASSQLAQLAGGVDNLASLQSRYFDAFFTEEQKLANLTQDLAAEFDALGLALPDNRAGVRELVSGIDQMTEAGREQYATILNLVPSLREYTMAMEEQAGVASALAQADQSAFRDIYETYTDAISASEQLAAERKRQLQDEMRAVDQLGQLIDSLLLSNQSILDPMERLQEAQRQFALLQVRAESGDTQAAGQLRGASTQYLDAAASYYGQSSAQYAEIFGDVTDGVEDLERQFGMSVDALGSIESIERRALREQQRAREVLESSLAAQLSQTESLSSMADLLISLPDQLASAIAAALPKADLGGGAGGSAGGGGSPSLAGAINDIYNDVLGRDADQTGLDYWMGDVARGHSLDDIRRSIEQNKADGSHALGLGTVPFDGYRAELHKGETVLPAPLAQMYRDNAPGRQSVDLEPLTRELHALRQEVAQLRAERRQDAAQAAGQRGEQVREQRKTSHNLKLKGRVT